MDVAKIRELADRIEEVCNIEGETEEVWDLMEEMCSMLDEGVLLEEVIEPGSKY